MERAGADRGEAARGPEAGAGWQLLLRPAIFAPLLVGLGAVASAWYAGYRLGGNDEGALLAAAGKILRGGVFYRDVDAYPLPGAHHLLAGVMWLFGERLGVARALAGLVYCAILLALYLASLRVLDRRFAALFGLSLLGLKLIAWPAFTAFFYWDLALAAACVALALLLHRRDAGPSWRLFFVGAAVGVAFVSKQNLGLLLGAAVGACLLLDGRILAQRSAGRAPRVAEWASVALGFALPVAPLLVQLIRHGLVGAMLESAFVRPFTGYVGTSEISFLVPLAWWELGGLDEGPVAFSYFPVSVWSVLTRGLLPGASLQPAYWLAGELFLRCAYLALPLALVLGAVTCLRAARRGRLREERGLLVLFVVALAVALSALPRADFAHLMGVYPPVWLLIFALLHRVATGAASARLRRLVRVATAAGVIVFLLVCGTLTQLRHGAMTARIELARATLREYPDNAYVETLSRLAADEIPEGEPLLVYGHEAYFYFLSGRYSPWPFSQLYPGQAGGDGGEAIVARLREGPPRLVIQGWINFPGVPGIATYAPALDAYLRSDYERDARVFRVHPPSSGVVPPPHRIQVLRPRRIPERS